MYCKVPSYTPYTLYAKAVTGAQQARVKSLWH